MAVLDPASMLSAMLMLFVLVNPRKVDSLTAVAVALLLVRPGPLAVAREEIARRRLLVDVDAEGGINRCCV